jgi:N-acetylglutamate synthase-like GNAT family acetyltransferase
MVSGKPLRVGVAKTAQAITRETPAHLLLHRSTQKMKEMMENGTLDETLMSLQEKRVRFPAVCCALQFFHACPCALASACVIQPHWRAEERGLLLKMAGNGLG